MEKFRTDAKAEGETIVIGGWECRDEQGREVET